MGSCIQRTRELTFKCVCMNVWIGINALLGLVGPSYAMKVPAPFASLLSLYVKRALIGYRQSYKPNYGIVVHRVPHNAINFEDDFTEIINEWEEDKASIDIKITRAAPL